MTPAPDGRWWSGAPHERFWLESTDREDLGTDLRAPLTDGSGKDNWRYTLFREATPGDLVFHYDKRVSAITSVSTIAGSGFEAPIVWAARGSYARDRNAQPVELPGYRVPLADHRMLDEPVSLDALRAARSVLQSLYDGMAPRGAPRYFPFELSERPVRPLQGYAFKLPAAFVDAFAGLGSAVSPVATSSALSSPTERFHHWIDRIDREAAPYAIAGLQRRRTLIGGLRREATSIFGTRPRTDDWAHHLGGRGELQFNVGIDVLPDQSPALRTGLAFSLELSRSMLDIAGLEPRIAWFNAWMRDHPDAFPDLAMWHYRQNQRSPDRPVGPISLDLIQVGTFIFIGDRQPFAVADPHHALRTMDRLFVLWDFVESRRNVSPGGEARAEPASARRLDRLRLDRGRSLDGKAWIQATTRQRTFDIYLRHAEIQRRLKTELLAEGFDTVVLEPSIGARAIDAVATRGKALWFYEVKTAGSDRACLREAIGQLLEYALWPGASRPHQLVVVGEPPLSVEGKDYLDELNAAFPIPLSYRQLVLDDPFGRKGI